MNKLFMMIGLPGSGKSYQANIISNTYNAKIFSSADYRKRLGDGNPNIFFNLEIDLYNHLLGGNNVIFDACNLNSNKRRKFLEVSKRFDCERIGVLVLRKIENCLKSNKQKEEPVPEDVMDMYYKTIQIPYREEGFDKIEIIYTDKDEDSINEDDYLLKYLTYDQNSKFHRYSLGLHNLFTYLYCKIHFEADLELFKAAFLHDIGKPFCRTETTLRGVVDGQSHYYGHDSVGAYESLFIKYNEQVDKLLIAFLINNHRTPTDWQMSDKSRNRAKLHWGEQKFNLINLLNEADINSH